MLVLHLLLIITKLIIKYTTNNVYGPKVNYALYLLMLMLMCYNVRWWFVNVSDTFIIIKNYNKIHS